MRYFLVLFLCALLSSACAPPSASIGPVDDVELVFETKDGALVSDITASVHLKCVTTEKDFVKPSSFSDGPVVYPTVATTRESPSEYTVVISLEKAYSAVSPPKRNWTDERYCRAFVRIFVSYEGASDIRSRVPGGRGKLADAAFPVGLGLVRTEEAEHDLTKALAEGVRGEYQIRCVHGGTSAGKPVNTLRLLKRTDQGWERKANLSRFFERSCDPAE